MLGLIFEQISLASAWCLLVLAFGGHALDDVGIWKVIKLGKHQHGQLGKHQLSEHKPNYVSSANFNSAHISQTHGLAGLGLPLKFPIIVVLI